MKILQVNPWFSPIHGGSARISYDISKYLSKSGHEVTFFASDYKFSQDWVKKEPEIRVYLFKTLLNVANFPITIGLIKQSRDRLTTFDIIHMHNYRSFQNIIVAYYAVKLKIPYVLQAHGSLPIMGSNKWLKSIYDIFVGNRLLKYAAKVIAVSSIEVKQYLDMGVPEEKIVLIPNSIDFPEYQKLPKKGVFKKKIGLVKNEKIILYVGRIHRIKGIDILVKAYSSLMSRLNNVKLVIVGPDDGYLSELLKLIKTMAIEESIIFVGALYGKSKIEAYVDADVCVIPSRYEIWGIAALEAMACGRPVLATDMGGLKEIISNGETGLLVAPENSEELLDCLTFVLKNPVVAEKMGMRGRDFVEKRFAVSIIGKKIEEVYIDCISQI